MSNELFPGMTPAGPPDDLRARVVQAARAAVPGDAVPATAGWSRWDFAWAAALLTVVVCHVVLLKHDGQRGSSVVAHEAAITRAPAPHRVPDDEWQEVGIHIATNQTRIRPERPLPSERLLEDPIVGRLETQ
jgi:hypothetical protein